DCRPASENLREGGEPGLNIQSNVLLTGATGFVGRALVARLLTETVLLTAAVRKKTTVLGKQAKQVVVPELTAQAEWQPALAGQNVVIHSAARVHVMNDQSNDPLAEFRKVNVEGTLNLARQASASGVKRFIFISSIKVNGEGTAPGKPYTAFDTPAPQDPYGVSKM